MNWVRIFVMMLCLIGGSHGAKAQTRDDEFYDPFADYSEYDTESDEEADIYFFKHGRFFSVSLAGGYRNFTGNMARTYGSGLSYGLYINYFFDFRLAFSLAYITGNHRVSIQTLTPNTYDGTVGISSFDLGLKYFFNPQNLVRTLANLNPYIIGGFSQNYRTYSLSTVSDISRDSTMGINFGGGVEIPIMKKKSFYGFQLSYTYVTFSDESKKVFLGSEQLTQTIDGDYWQAMALIGSNF